MPRAKRSAAKRPRGSKTAKNNATANESAQTAGAGTEVTSASAIVTVDRRTRGDRRKTPDRRKQNVPVAVERRKLQRRAKVNRRRQIDPTTCERDYTADEIEFMNALDQYKRASGRMFPTCSEILEVIRKLGYEKRPTPVVQDPLALPAIPVADIFCPARSG